MGDFIKIPDNPNLAINISNEQQQIKDHFLAEIRERD